MLYVIQVTTGKEMEVAKVLREQNMKVFVPRENRMIHSDGVWSTSEYTLFPGYVFLDITYNAENYYKIKKIPGVVQFLGDNMNPSRLSYLEAEWIRLLTGENDSPLEPTVIKVDEKGNITAMNGILKRVDSRIVKLEKRYRRATFEITICGEKKKVHLSVVFEDDKAEAAEDGDQVEEQDSQPKAEKQK